jgi:Cd2+/Zn2+-exporting ATPase
MNHPEQRLARARRLTPAGEEEVPAAVLPSGDLIRVRPGDALPADGRMRAGRSALNEASITGESLPVDKGVGESVFAETQNLTGALEEVLTRAGEGTTLGRVRALILAAEQTKLPIMRLIDWYVGDYTPLVLVIRLVVWMFTHELSRMISVLVIACPCAFILGTPTAMVAAIAAASRLGLLIKNVAELELAARVHAFVFDKTGTRTQGRLQVVWLASLEGVKPAELLRRAVLAEQHSHHPVARAIVECAGDVGLPLAEATEVRESPGLGLTALVQGVKIRAGRESWLRAQGVESPGSSLLPASQSELLSLLQVAREGRAVGVIGLRDQVRPEARESLAALLWVGVSQIVMVTGDRTPVGTQVARQVGYDAVHAECLPHEKVEQVRRLRARGWPVAVVGDGVNDASALAAGGLGIAMGAAGSDVAIHSASILLMNNDLHRLPFLVELSRATRRTINQNFLIGLVFIVGGLTLAALGYIHPIVAAILHNSGSLRVVFHSARLVRSGEAIEPTPANAAAPALEQHPCRLSSPHDAHGTLSFRVEGAAPDRTRCQRIPARRPYLKARSSRGRPCY